MGDLVSEAIALHRRALGDGDRGRYDLARRRLLAALTRLERVADDQLALPTKVRVLVTLSAVEFEIQGGDAGLDRLSDAQLILTRLDSAELSFAVANALGLQAMRSGRDLDALAHFALAEQNLDTAPLEDACTLLVNRGSLHLERLSLAAARDDLERCVRLAESPAAEGKLASLAFMARHNHGYLEFLAGNLPAALRLMADAAKTAGEVSLSVSYLDQARVLIEAGLADAADQALSQAAEEFRRGRLSQHLAETELARAECAMLIGAYPAARRLASAARTSFKHRGNDRWRRTAELILVQADLADGRAGTRVINPALRLAGEFIEQGLGQQAKTAQLTACSALVAARRIVDAEALYATIPPARRVEPIAMRVHHDAVGARLSMATGQLPRARRAIKSGLSTLAAHQAQFGSIDLQTAGAVYGRQLVQLDLELALASHRPAAVFEAIERGRAVSTRLTSVTAPSDQTVEPLAELRQLTGMIKLLADDPAMTDYVQDLRQRSAGLYRELSAISWRSVGQGVASKPATLAEVGAALRGVGKTMISFCESAGQLAAVITGNGRPSLVRLQADSAALELLRRAQADLNVLAFPRLPDALRAAATSSLRHGLTRLDEMLIRPLALPNQPLVIVPTAELSTLPWNCLPSLRGCSIEVTPTATTWLNSTPVKPSDTLAVTSLAGPGLVNAEGEVRQIREVWSGAGVLATEHWGADANRAQLAKTLANSAVVHIAAHGVHRHQNPLFSSLQLTDGPWFAYELDHGQIATHVVLSACELGQSTVRPGEETLGLTSVLLQLGTRCVIAGVAQVADELAAEVMLAYHQRLARGVDSATALAEATSNASQEFVPFSCFGQAWSRPTLR